MDDREVEKRSKRLEKEAKHRDTEISMQIKDLVAQPRGRMFVWWLLEIGKVGLQPFTQDPTLTAFACGELNVGQQILARLLTDAPEGYLNMLQEKNDAARRASDQPDGQRGGAEPFSENPGGAGSFPVWDDPSEFGTSEG